MKRRLRKISFREGERLFGDYIYRNHYPFNTLRGSTLELQRSMLGVFYWFLDETNRRSPRMQWERFVLDGRKSPVDEFHHRLFKFVVERSNDISGRLRIAVVIDGFDMLDPTHQKEYRSFQERFCGPGFKLSLVLAKPEGFVDLGFNGSCSGIAFGDLFFVLVLGEAIRLFGSYDGA